MSRFPNRFNVISTLKTLSAQQSAILAAIGYPGQSWYVDPVNGGDGLSGGKSPDSAFATIGYTLGFVQAGDAVFLLPGQYDEAVITVPRTDSLSGAALNNLFFIGLGGRGAAFIEPSTEDQAGMIVHADDVTLINVGVAAEDETSAVALTVTGARFRAYGCKIEGGASQVIIGPGTDAQVTAGTRGKGADSLFEDCEICWGTEGIVLQGTDYGGCTQTYIRNCRFHDLTAESVGENVGSGGSAAVTFFGLNLRDNIFELDEAGAAPTKWVSLNANNANSGIAAGNQFPTALNSGKNLVSTKVLWTGNFHTGGLSTTQPS